MFCACVIGIFSTEKILSVATGLRQMHKNYKHKYFVIGLYDGRKQNGKSEVTGGKLKHVFERKVYLVQCVEKLGR